jgi:ferredoxin
VKIIHNAEICSFHGECVEVAPEVFGWNDDDSLHIKLPEPPPEHHLAVRDACRLCPTQSLSLEGDTDAP